MNPLAAENMASADFQLGAPGTGVCLRWGDDGACVDGDGNRYQQQNGVWHFIRPERLEAVNAFAKDYAMVRHREGRTPLNAAAVAALPHRDLSGEMAEMWSQRATSFDRFVTEISAFNGPSLPGLLVDVGAGCGWLAAHMARSGWRAAAVDVTVDGGDGLDAARLHEADLLLARAEMDALPFANNSIDLVVFNASLHYAPNVSCALREAARVARPGGAIAILDSPLFKDPAAGEQMVAEFTAATRARHDIEPARHFGPGFVTEADVERFKDEYHPSHWVRIDDRQGLTGRLRSAVGARRAGREIANRPLIIARPTAPEATS